MLDPVSVVTKSGATADMRSTGVRSGRRADLNTSTNVPKLLPPPCPPIPRPAAAIRKPQGTSLVASHQRPLALDAT